MPKAWSFFSKTPSHWVSQDLFSWFLCLLPHLPRPGVISYTLCCISACDSFVLPHPVFRMTLKRDIWMTCCSPRWRCRRVGLVSSILSLLHVPLCRSSHAVLYSGKDGRRPLESTTSAPVFALFSPPSAAVIDECFMLALGFINSEKLRSKPETAHVKSKCERGRENVL